jgi:UDP-N-acetylmuramoyl-tripeptide--D-alanyl-D-alanine ligase
VAAVTGSVGKTTAKEAIAAVLARRYRLLRSEGNANNEIGLPLTLLALESEHQAAVLEMAMYAPGEIALLCDIARPQIGVVTNVGPTHLERLGTIERIAAAKGELVQALPAGGCAILNGDDPLARGLGALSRAPVITFGLGIENTVRATNVQSQGWQGVAFRGHVSAGGPLGWPEADVDLSTTMLGAHAVQPALAAVAVGLAMGVSWEAIAAGLTGVGAGPRLVPIAGPNGSMLLDDSYNASPMSAGAALDLLATLPGRRMALLGDMLELGAAEEHGHREVGERCAEVVDVLWTLGERGQMIAAAALSAGMPADRVRHLADCDEAIALARSTLGAGDVLLIKGSRGMAMEGIVAALRRAD